MLARLWHGVTPSSKSESYLELMRTVAVADYTSVPGNLGAQVLRRTEGDLTHFQMLTFWENLDAIKAFAGDDYLAAKYYDFDRDYLVELEATVTVYEVF